MGLEFVNSSADPEKLVEFDPLQTEALSPMETQELIEKVVQLDANPWQSFHNLRTKLRQVEVEKI